MAASALNPASFKRVFIDGTAISANELPLKKHRLLFDKGPHLAQLVHKRAEATLDYFFDLSRLLEPDESITFCRAYVDVVLESFDGTAWELMPNVDIRLYVERLNFAPDGIVIALRGGGNDIRYTVNVRYETDRANVNLLRFSVVTTGEAVKIALLSCTVIGGAVGTRPDAHTPDFGDGPLSFMRLVGGVWTPITQLDLGSVDVGQTKSESIRIANTGTLPTKMRAAALAAPYAFAAPGAVGGEWTVAAGGYVTATLTFTPTEGGSFTAALQLTYGTTNATMILPIAGLGVASAILISVSDAVFQEEEPADYGTGPVSLRTFNGASWASASGITFDPILPGETMAMGVRLYNDGTLPVQASVQSVAAPFSFTAQGGGASWLINPGEFVAGSVAFVPTKAGDATGSVSIQYGAQSATLSIPLAGSAIAPPVTLERVRIAGNQFYASATAGAPTPEQFIRLRSVNWFGAEGTNYTPHGTWAVRYTSIIDQIAGWGFNCIRLPFSGDFCTPGRTPPPTAIDFDLNPEFQGKTSLEILDLIIDYCASKGLYVVLDHHRRQAGNGADGGPTDPSYTVAQWHASWAVMANRYGANKTVVGADIHNEPHNLEWNAWATLCEACGNHILSIAPDWIIFVEGVGHIGDDHYWWGGQLAGVRTRPVVLNTPNRIAYSPHEYGQSVGGQQWLAYDGQTPPANWPFNLTQVWDDHWGFIFYEGIAPIWIGEMGGHFGYDAETGALTKPHATPEREWMTRLIRYLNFDRDLNGSIHCSEVPPSTIPAHRGMSYAFWSYNPNSGDTGGLVRGDWSTPQQGKLDLLAPIRNETYTVPLPCL